jgi:hypothetical protein
MSDKYRKYLKERLSMSYGPKKLEKGASGCRRTGLYSLDYGAAPRAAVKGRLGHLR